MNGAKRSAEAVGCKNTSVGERSALEGSPRASSGGRSGSENVGLSNANIGENPMPRKPKGSSARFVHGGVRRGRENASSQCSSTRRYGAEVTHAILPGKARTTFKQKGTCTRNRHRWCRKVKEVGDLMTGEPATEAPVNGGRNYNGPKVAKFLVGHVCEDAGLPAPGQKDPMKLDCSLGLGEEGLLPGGPEPSVRYHSGRARILTLCQDLRAKGQSQASQKVTEACKGFLGPDGDWPRVQRQKGACCQDHPSSGTKVGLSDPTVPSGRAVAQRIKVTLGITG
ncbi:UNVERIFIED_CONTAM: hypothetical protein Sindi_2347000 [Sesamum indicum]